MDDKGSNDNNNSNSNGNGNSNSNSNLSCKLLIIGDARVGKSSILHALSDTDFEEEYTPTTSSDFAVKEMRIGHHNVTVQVWDVSQGSMGRSFLRGSDALMLVVDLSQVVSMKNLQELYERVRNLSGFEDDSFPCVLVGNKADLFSNNSSKRQITLDEMRDWADKCRASSKEKIDAVEVSARTKVGVIKAFEKLIEKFIRRPTTDSEIPPQNSSLAQIMKSRESADLNVTPSIVSTTQLGTEVLSSIPTTSYQNMDSDNKVCIAKVVMAGPTGAGKTCILTKYISPEFEISANYMPTIGADFRVAEMPVNDMKVSLQVWDTAGDIKIYKSIGKSLYKDADGIILVYDITKRATFKALDSYWDCFLKYSGIDETQFFPAILVGNKSDISEQRQVSLEEVVDWCTNKRPQKQITYMECSAKHNIGVSDIFHVISHEHYDYALLPRDDYMTETDFDTGVDTDDYDSVFEPSEHTNSEIGNLGATPRSNQHNVGDGGGRRQISAGERVANSRMSKGRNGKGGANANRTDVDEERTCWCFSPL